MSRRAYAYAVALLLVTALIAPALAGAVSGGAPVGPAARGQGGGVSATGSRDGTATVSGNGITLRARVSTLLRDQLRFTGRIPAGSAGDTVVVERFDPKAGWVPTTSSSATPDGTFRAVWRTDYSGRFGVRVIVHSPGRASTRIAAGSPALNVTVYRSAIATTFGQGFYGQRTACGEILKPDTLGVAHRWLPCGTRVAIYYRGATIIVPVIDRGPYANHADWDLTEATARELHMSGTNTIGAVSLAGQHQTH